MVCPNLAQQALMTAQLVPQLTANHPEATAQSWSAVHQQPLARCSGGDLACVALHWSAAA